MKKLILLLSIFLIVGGCTQDYEDINPEKPVSGTVVTIDSTQWTSAMIQSGDNVLIYKDGEIRKIEIYDPVSTFFFGVIIGLIIGMAFGYGLAD